MGLLKLQLKGLICTGLPENFVGYSFRRTTLCPPKQWSQLTCLKSHLSRPLPCLTSKTKRAIATYSYCFTCVYTEPSSWATLCPAFYQLKYSEYCFLQEALRLRDPPKLHWKPAYICSYEYEIPIFGYLKDKNFIFYHLTPKITEEHAVLVTNEEGEGFRVRWEL